MASIVTFPTWNDFNAAVSTLPRPFVAKIAADGTMVYNRYKIEDLVAGGYATFGSETVQSTVLNRFTLSANCPAHSYEIENFAEYFTNQLQYNGAANTFIKLSVIPTCWNEIDTKFVLSCINKYPMVGMTYMASQGGIPWLNLNLASISDSMTLTTTGSAYTRYPTRTEQFVKCTKNLVWNPSIGELPAQAFRFCVNLERIFINKTLNAVDGNAYFEQCSFAPDFSIDFLNYSNLWAAEWMFDNNNKMVVLPLMRGTTDRELAANRFKCGNLDFRYTFRNCTSLERIEPVIYLNSETSRCPNIIGMFSNCNALTRVYIKQLSSRNYIMYQDESTETTTVGGTAHLYLPNIDAESIKYLINNASTNTTVYNITFNSTQKAKLTTAEWNELKTVASSKNWNILFA